MIKEKTVFESSFRFQTPFLLSVHAIAIRLPENVSVRKVRRVPHLLIAASCCLECAFSFSTLAIWLMMSFVILSSVEFSQ